MGALVGLGVGIGLLLVWSAFTMPRTQRAPRDAPAAGSPRRLGEAGLDTVSVPGLLVLLQRRLRPDGGAGGPGRVGDAAGRGGVRGDGRLTCPFAVVAARARRRQREFAEVWPEAVDNLASAPSAPGMSLPDALAALAVRGPEPLRPAFDAFALDYQVTGRFGECLDRLKARARRPGRRPRRRGTADRPRGRRRRARPAAAQPVRVPPRRRAHPLGDGVAPGVDRQRRAARGRRALAGAAHHVVPGRRDPALRLAGGVLVLAVGAGLCVAAYWLMMRIGRLPVERRILR